MKRSLKLLLLQCVLFFLSPNHLFKYFKRRYSSDQIACLNQILSLRGKLNSVSINLCFTEMFVVWSGAQTYSVESQEGEGVPLVEDLEGVLEGRDRSV